MTLKSQLGLIIFAAPKSSKTAASKHKDDDSFIVHDDDDVADQNESSNVPSSPVVSGKPKVPFRTPLATNNGKSAFDELPDWIPRKTPIKATPCKTPVQRQFSKHRETIAAELYAEYNKRVFGNVLPTDMKIVWSNTLNTTAGRAVLMRRGPEHTASIELSTKV